MNRFLKRAAVLAAAAVFSWQSLAFAADLTTVRFHSGSEHDRVVFDLSDLPSYKESLSDDRRTLTLDFAGTKDKRLQKLPVKSSRIESISYASKGGHLIVTMRLKAGLAYDLHTLKNPVRLFVDVMPSGAAEACSWCGGVWREYVRPGRHNRWRLHRGCGSGAHEAYVRLLG